MKSPSNCQEGLLSGPEPAAVTLKELEMRALQPAEKPRAWELVEGEHFLGAGREVGRTLIQVVHHQGRWVALLVWGPAAMKLIDRDQWIGWTPQQRAQRLGLKTLSRNTRAILCATDVPIQYQAGIEAATAQRDPPLKRSQIDSLLEALHEAPDPRRSNRKNSSLPKSPYLTT